MAGHELTGLHDIASWATVLGCAVGSLHAAWQMGRELTALRSFGPGTPEQLGRRFALLRAVVGEAAVVVFWASVFAPRGTVPRPGLVFMVLSVAVVWGAQTVVRRRRRSQVQRPEPPAVAMWRMKHEVEATEIADRIVDPYQARQVILFAIALAARHW